MTYIEDIKKPRGFINVAYFTAEHIKTKLAGASEASKKIKVNYINQDSVLVEVNDECNCKTRGEDDGKTTCWEHHDCYYGDCTHGE